MSSIALLYSLVQIQQNRNIWMHPRKMIQNFGKFKDA